MLDWTVCGVDAALTVTAPTNSTVVRRIATETGTILYARITFSQDLTRRLKTFRRYYKGFGSNVTVKTVPWRPNGQKMNRWDDLTSVDRPYFPAFVTAAKLVPNRSWWGSECGAPTLCAPRGVNHALTMYPPAYATDLNAQNHCPKLEAITFLRDNSATASVVVMQIFKSVLCDIKNFS